MINRSGETANHPLESICVYCGSSPGYEPHFIERARELGELLAERGVRLVYGGGNVGLMGALADAALDGGGEVIGVIPESLAAKEVAHRGVTELIVVDSMHERKEEMARRADGFIGMPGGIGTIEELFEVFTWRQLGLHDKPVALLETDGFFTPLIEQLGLMVRNGFLKQLHLDDLLIDTDPARLLGRMAAYCPSHSDKWIGRNPKS